MSDAELMFLYGLTEEDMAQIEQSINNLGTKIDTMNTTLSAKIDTMNTTLSAKIDTAISINRYQSSGSGVDGPQVPIPSEFALPPAYNGACAICLEALEKYNRVIRLRCTHEFHDTCLVHWHGPCPICRAARVYGDIQEQN